MANSRGRHRSGIGFFASLVIAFAGVTAAYAGDLAKPVNFDLPAQTLAASLRALANQADIQIIFSPEDVADRDGPAISGVMSAREALSRLLEATRLEFVVDGEDTIVIRARNAVATSAPPTALSSASASERESAERQRGELEEIVVTAQRREESLQDVAIAVTAMDGTELQEQQVINVEDMTTLVPNVTVSTSFGNGTISIRGIGMENTLLGSDPGVASHIDGVVISRSPAQLGGFLDLERVEVLRGPQGTLYGRNATGGALNLITRKPTPEPEGSLTLTAGNYSRYGFEGAFGGPLVGERVRGRIAARLDERGGYGENVRDGSDIDDLSVQSFRGQLDFDLSESVNLLLSADYQEQDDAAYGLKYVEPLYPEFARRPVGLVRGGSFATDPRDVNADVDIANRREAWGLAATATWTLGEHMSLKSITGYREFVNDPRVDQDQSSAIVGSGAQLLESDQLSEELQLLYKSERLNGVFGLYYFEESMFGDNRVSGTTSTPDTDPPSALLAHFRGTADIDAWSVFANLNYRLTDAFNLIAGGRYTHETRAGFTDLFRSPATPGVIRTFGDERSFSDFSPRLGIEWHAQERLMMYVTYAEGFKSGVFPLGQTTPVLEPELIESVELGLKSDLIADTLRMNFAVFDYDYENLQISKTVPVAPGVSVLLFENAARATSRGAELEVSWLATERLRVDGFLAYLDAQYEDYSTTDPLLAGTPAGDVLEQLAGNRMSNSPEWSGNLRLRYEWPVTLGTLTFGAEATYKDDVFFSAQNSPRLAQDSVTLYGVSLKLTSSNERWFVRLWGDNLGDEFVYAWKQPISSARTIAGWLAPPRTYGVTVGFDF